MSFFAAAPLSLSLMFTPVQYTHKDAERHALNNLGHEFIECAAYMTVVAAALAKTPGREATGTKYRQTSDELIKRAWNIAEGLGQKVETLEARMQMATKTMLDEMGHSSDNISILLNKYSDGCITAAGSPDARYSYWLNRASQELGTGRR